MYVGRAAPFSLWVKRKILSVSMSRTESNKGGSEVEGGREKDARRGERSRVVVGTLQRRRRLGTGQPRRLLPTAGLDGESVTGSKDEAGVRVGEHESVALARWDRAVEHDRKRLRIKGDFGRNEQGL